MIKMRTMSTFEDLCLLSFIAKKQSETMQVKSGRLSDTKEIGEQKTDECGIYPYIKEICELSTEQHCKYTMKHKAETKGHKVSFHN
jgi:hypothetical protein